jgi:hypothetical protein
MNPDGRLTPFPRAGSLWIMRSPGCIPVPIRALEVFTDGADVVVRCTSLLPMGLLPDPLELIAWHESLLCGVLAPYPSARQRAARRAAERDGRR